MRIIYWVIAIIITISFAYSLATSGNDSPVQHPISLIQPFISIESPVFKAPKMDEIINPIVQDYEGSISIIVEDLKNDEILYSKDSHQRYLSASLYKLWILAVVYEEIESTNLSEKTVLSNDIYSLYRKFGVDPIQAGAKPGVITRRVDEALEEMITVSDNPSALLLADRVAGGKVEKFLKNLELDDSDYGDDSASPSTSAFDTAQILKQMYKGQLVSKDASEKMLDILKFQKINHKLPKYLPDNTPVAHKTGELDSYSHDAGIVFTDHTDYLIVVLSSYSDPEQSNEVISQVSKEVYDYIKTYRSN